MGSSGLEGAALGWNWPRACGLLQQRQAGGIGSYVRQMAHSLIELGHFSFVLRSVPSKEGLTWDGAARGLAGKPLPA